MTTQIDYSKLIVTKPQKGYSTIQSWSHYDDALTTTKGVNGGNSRKWGDADMAVQIKAIDSLIAASKRRGLNTRETALVLAIARHQSGFNPDAASNESATGLGQFIDGAGTDYGLSEANRWNIQAQADALVSHFIDNRDRAETRGLGEEYIYGNKGSALI